MDIMNGKQNNLGVSLKYVKLQFLTIMQCQATLLQAGTNMQKAGIMIFIISKSY